MRLDKILEKQPVHLSQIELVCGVDEVGKGCAAGPVVAAAVILPSNFESSLLRDSKKLSESQRNEAYKLIVDNALAYSVQATNAKHINKYGINSATFKAMNKAISTLSVVPQHLLIDGNQWKGTTQLPFSCVVKGDDTYMCIAAAAIIAKVRRDDYMRRLSGVHPGYDFENNKGYLTKKHGEGILKLGITEYHRTQYVDTWKNNLIK